MVQDGLNTPVSDHSAGFVSFETLLCGLYVATFTWSFLCAHGSLISPFVSKFPYSQKDLTLSGFIIIYIYIYTHTYIQQDFPGGSDSKASVYNVRDLGSIPGLGRFPGEGNGNPLQYSCLENPMDGGAWCRLLSMGLQRVGHN